MTVCLATINNKQNSIAFATDRMVTSTSPPIEFEHVLPKLTQINNSCIALSAGDAICGKEIFDVVKEGMGQTNPPIKHIAERIRDVYQQKRLQVLETVHLRSRGLNHKIFFEAGSKLLPSNIYAQIDYAFATFGLPVEILIAGVDESGPNIFGIRNPGLLDCYKPIGFHIIGSGTMHALVSLTEHYSPDSSLAAALYTVFRAKRVAEVAPGVGQETDIGMVFLGEKIKYFSKNDELFKRFDAIYKTEKKSRKDLTMGPEIDMLIEVEAVGDMAGQGSGKKVDNGPEEQAEGGVM
jgi:20S proteasome alpha/beta subunit